MSDFSLSEINDRISKESVFIDKLREEIASTVIGQTDLINRLLIGILANGHILIEGVPGLAKTLLVKTIAQLIEAKFQRIQFTPDMLPADLIGTLIYNQKTWGFETRKGPIFSNIILADEISPDTCRLWDEKTERKLDKDIFRKDLGRLVEGYQEVARRLNILHEQSNIKPISFPKPKEVKIKKK